MWIKHNRGLFKILLLLIVLLIGGIVVSGCARTGALPRGWSGGIVADGTLFLASMEGSLVAINIADGSRQQSEPLKVQAPSGGFGCTPAPTSVAIYGTPAVSADLVYIGGYNGKIYAYNPSSLQMNDDYPPEGNLEPIVGGLVVALDKVYFGGSDGKVYSLNTNPLEKGWDFQTGGKIWSTPVIDNGTLFIGSFDKKLYALNTTDGKKKWEFEAEGAIVSTPVVHDNMVYTGSFDRYLYAVDATTGNLRWKFQADNWFWTQPVIYNNTLYAGNLDGKIYILNAKSGEKLVEPIDLGSPIASTPVLVDDSVIVASEEGMIYILDTNNNQKSELKNLEEEIQAPLYANEGIVYIHSEKDIVYAINIRTGAIQEFVLGSK